MRRRDVLKTGAASAAAGLFPWATQAGTDSGALLRRLSVVRAQEGLPTLQLRADLTEMARRQSFFTGLQGLATHLDGSGRDPTARARQAGYPGLLLGETIAETYDGPLETLDLWLELDRTRAVLLNPAAREVGVFGAQNGTGRASWVLVVGAPQRSRPS